MKITKSRLYEIIKEEIKSLQEGLPANPNLPSLKGSEASIPGDYLGQNIEIKLLNSIKKDPQFYMLDMSQVEGQLARENWEDFMGNGILHDFVFDRPQPGESEAPSRKASKRIPGADRYFATKFEQLVKEELYKLVEAGYAIGTLGTGSKEKYDLDDMPNPYIDDEDLIRLVKAVDFMNNYIWGTASLATDRELVEEFHDVVDSMIVTNSAGDYVVADPSKWQEKAEELEATLKQYNYPPELIELYDKILSHAKPYMAEGFSGNGPMAQPAVEEARLVRSDRKGLSRLRGREVSPEDKSMYASMQLALKDPHAVNDDIAAIFGPVIALMFPKSPNLYDQILGNIFNAVRDGDLDLIDLDRRNPSNDELAAIISSTLPKELATSKYVNLVEKVS